MEILIDCTSLGGRPLDAMLEEEGKDAVPDHMPDICCDPSQSLPFSNRRRASQLEFAMQNLFHRKTEPLCHAPEPANDVSTDEPMVGMDVMQL